MDSTLYDTTKVYKYKDLYKVQRDDVWDVVYVTKKLRHIPIHTTSDEAMADEWIAIERGYQDERDQHPNG